MAVREILLLGNPKLYEICEAVSQDEITGLEPTIQDLHDTMMDFRHKYGVMKRLVYMHIDKPALV
jgi:peptide deformylase